MKASNKKIMFFVSTAGHMKGVRTLSSALTGALGADVSVLNFPDDLTVLSGQKFSADSLLQLRAVDRVLFQASSVVVRERLGFVSRCISIFYEILKPVFLFFSLVLFYTLFALNVFYFGVSVFFGRKNKQGCLNFSVSRSFIFIKNFLPNLQSWLFRFNFLTGFLRSQNLLFGIWGDNKVSQDISSLFSASRPDLIVLPEFNWGYKYHLIGCVAREFNIPILVIPYTMAGAEEWIASFKVERECRVVGVFRRLLSMSHPEWVVDNGSGSKLILPVSWIVSCASHEFSPQLPWVTNSVSEFLVAVDNEFTREFYAREGVDTSAWLVLGSLEEDVLFKAGESCRAGLVEPYVLIALPPDQFGVLDASDLEFSNYNELVSFLVGRVCTVVGPDVSVVVALHPRTSRSDVAFLDAYDVLISDFSVESLIPGAFVYIAVSSATIRWAIASAIPVINFDVYHYNYADYDDCRGVVNVNDSQGFESLLSRFFQDKIFYDTCVCAQRDDARHYFKLDGLSQDRVVGLIRSIIYPA